MNIIEKINPSLVESYHFKFYGDANDIATINEIHMLLDNWDNIEKYYSAKNAVIENVDDFIDYLFLAKFYSLKEFKEYNNNSQIQEVINKIKKFIDEKFPIRKVIMFIKEKSINLFKDENLKNKSLLSHLLSLAFQYHSGCESVLQEIIKLEFPVVAWKFNELNKIIIKYPNLCEEVLDENHFQIMKGVNIEHYFNILRFFYQKTDYKDKVKKNFIVIYKYAEEIFNKMDSSNALSLEIEYNKICSFFKEDAIKSSLYKNLEKNIPSIKQKVIDYIKTNGKEFSVEIPFKELMQPFNDDNIPLISKILLLTHLPLENKKISIYEYIMQIKDKNDLINSLGTSMDHDTYLTIWKQEQLEFYDQVYLHFLQYYVNKEKITDFISIISALTKHVCELYKLSFEDLNFESDYNVLLNMYQFLFSANENNNSFLEKGLNYSLTLLMIGIIEKILRNLYIEQKGNLVYDYIRKQGTLGELLKENEIINLLGLDNVNIITYYLINYHSKDLNLDFGSNFRNKFAHYDITPSEMNFRTTLKVTQILLLIINELSIAQRK